MDRCGQNHALPAARFLVQRNHLAFVRDHPNYPARFWDIPGLRYDVIDGDYEVCPGVRILPTPGHAPGHQSLVVDLPITGRVILTGEAVFLRENLETANIRAVDPESASASLALIRATVDGNTERCFVSHDPDAWASWRHAAEAYT
jgi:N-acyl homoserine lactone hydrolase